MRVHVAIEFPSRLVPDNSGTPAPLEAVAAQHPVTLERQQGDGVGRWRSVYTCLLADAAAFVNGVQACFAAWPERVTPGQYAIQIVGDVTGEFHHAPA